MLVGFGDKEEVSLYRNVKLKEPVKEILGIQEIGDKRTTALGTGMGCKGLDNWNITPKPEGSRQAFPEVLL